MENTVWKNENLIAQDIADNFELEREIRKASSRKELLCPDKGCKCRIVRYCHGEVKGAYFAHLTNEKCDYADFDKNDTSVFRLLRLKLYKHFSELGYNVKCEEKVLEHHYSQLVFELCSSRKMALEFGSKQTSANLLDNLAENYERVGVGVRWIVVSDTNYGGKENELFYLKRYLLNTANKKEYIIISTDGTAVSQSRWDCNKYEYNGRPIFLNGYNEIYSEEADLSLLTIDGDEFTVRGFGDRYCQWLHRKKQALEEERKRQKEIAQRLAERQTQANESIAHIPSTPPMYMPRYYSQARPKSISKSYEERKSEILGRMDQQEEQVRDSTDTRWIRCELCGKIGEDAEFSSYVGPNHLNLGICSDCTRRSR